MKAAGNRNVEPIGAGHDELAAKAQNAMMPKVIWGYSTGWELLELAFEIKTDADRVSNEEVLTE